MAEAADALDGDQIARARRHGTGMGDHVFIVAAVEMDAGDAAVLAGNELAAAACAATAAVPTAHPRSQADAGDATHGRRQDRTKGQKGTRERIGGRRRSHPAIAARADFLE